MYIAITHLKRTVTLHGLDAVFPNGIYQRFIFPKFNRFDLIFTIVIPGTVTKANLLSHIEILHKRVHEKHASKHDGFMVAMSLVIAAENAVSVVY